MRLGVIPASDFESGDHRLNGSFYLSEDEAAMRHLRGWAGGTKQLRDLTTPHGIYNGGIFRIIEALDENHGRPYVSAKHLVMADIVPTTFISNKHGELLQKLTLREGMIVITCSGMNLGSSVWVREDMAGLCASGDLIRVEVNPIEIAPGYVHAFLSSKYGWVSLRKMIFGGNIKHIEPNAVGRILIPRIGKTLEAEVDRLIRSSARLRTEATATIREEARKFDSHVGGFTLTKKSPRVSAVGSNSIQERMEATFHDPTVELIRKNILSVKHVTIASLCERIFLPGIFKRIHIEDENFGAPYFTGASLYRLEPDSKGILSRKTTLFDDVQLHEGTVLVQAFGQEGGITGRPVWIGRFLSGKTSTHMLARLFPKSPEYGVLLFAFLSSDIGYQQVRVLPFGGSIPHFSERGIGAVLIPKLGDSVEQELCRQVKTALDKRDDAIELDQQARRIVEQAIEENA